MSEPKLVLHVRFAPDGQVTDIGECPASLPPQAWFNKLTVEAGHSFQPLAGGRGVFRLTLSELAAVLPSPG